MATDEENLATQLRKGVLEYCVLASLRKGQAYGLELAGTLASSGLLGNEGTLYPLLSRLRGRGWVQTSWRESTSGPPRRYYELTPSGSVALDAFISTWSPFVRGVAEVLEEAR